MQRISFSVSDSITPPSPPRRKGISPWLNVTTCVCREGKMTLGRCIPTSHILLLSGATLKSLHCVWFARCPNANLELRFSRIPGRGGNMTREQQWQKNLFPHQRGIAGDELKRASSVSLLMQRAQQSCSSACPLHEKGSCSILRWALKPDLHQIATPKGGECWKVVIKIQDLH